MPSQALGTLAMAGGQEGYDQPLAPLAPVAAPASTQPASAVHKRHSTIDELREENTALDHILHAEETVDKNLERKEKTHVAVNAPWQDSPEHDFHVHTEVANEVHRRVREEIGLEKVTLRQAMSDDRPAATAAAAHTEGEERRNSLDDLEKTAPAEADLNTNMDRTLSTDEKPAAASPISPSAAAVPLPDSATSSPESAQAAATPALNITLLLPTGSRHSFRISESYLTKRGVSIPGVDAEGKKDVFSVSVYQIKELILREWREEWGGEAARRRSGEGSAETEGQMRGKPSSPAAIRLIFFGRLLGDGDKVEDCRFNKQGANVVHMTVRPQDVVDEEETERKRNEGRSSRRSRHEEGEETPGCRCVIL